MNAMEPDSKASVNKITDQIVVFTLDELLYAIPLPDVVKVIHAIEIRPLPEAPEIISGIINVNGRITPVADIRKRFGLSIHEIGTDDHIIIADTGKREVAILVDSVTGVSDLSGLQHEQTKKPLPFTRNMTEAAKIGDDLVLIYDLHRFLSLDEEEVLDLALNKKKNES
jgi:purine-binding chemotaxis protein CheW